MKASPDEVTAFELLTRALVGITLQSVQILEREVSLPQFRLLLVLDGLGEVPSSRLAAAMGMNASSVTRLADRLETARLLVRGTDQRSRSIVTLAVSPAGHDLVRRVVRHRRALLARVLDRMDDADRDDARRVATQFAALVGNAATLSTTGPLPI